MSVSEVNGLSAKRTVIHLDLDAFYAQVEQKRKQIPEGTPLAVQQWDGLIAVNYAARARGVTRHMRTAQALEACPDLVLVHVQTIGSGGAGAASAEGSADARGNTKACLQRYRQASGAIMRVLRDSLSHGALMEKGGLDEVFVDVTPMVDAELRQMRGGVSVHGTHGQGDPSTTDNGSTIAQAMPTTNRIHDDHMESHMDGHMEGHMEGHMGGYSSALRRLMEVVQGHTVIEGGVQLDLDLEADQRLMVAAGIAKRLRDAVFQDPSCGYTCSAGIGPNKLLSKICSARNKPNKQTLLLPRAVPGLMQDLPIGKLRWLGGKLGEKLNEALGAKAAGDVQAASLQDLNRIVGDKAWWLYNYVRGIDDEPVKPKGPIKSLNSCKSFNSTSNLNEVSRWMSMLAYELCERMAEDEWEHHRRPRNLMLNYRGGRGALLQDRSVRCSMPSHSASTGPSAEAIAGAALAMFSITRQTCNSSPDGSRSTNWPSHAVTVERCHGEVWHTYRKLTDALPCTRLALSATDFFQPPAEGARAITHFLAPQPSQQLHQQPAQQATQPRQRPKNGRQTITQFLTLQQLTQLPQATTQQQPTTVLPMKQASQPTTQPTIQPTTQPTTQPSTQPTIHTFRQPSAHAHTEPTTHLPIKRTTSHSSTERTLEIQPEHADSHHQQVAKRKRSGLESIMTQRPQDTSVAEVVLLPAPTHQPITNQRQPPLAPHLRHPHTTPHHTLFPSTTPATSTPTTTHVHPHVPQATNSSNHQHDSHLQHTAAMPAPAARPPKTSSLSRTLHSLFGRPSASQPTQDVPLTHLPAAPGKVSDPTPQQNAAVSLEIYGDSGHAPPKADQGTYDTVHGCGATPESVHGEGQGQGTAQGQAWPHEQRNVHAHAQGHGRTLMHQHVGADVQGAIEPEMEAVDHAHNVQGQGKRQDGAHGHELVQEQEEQGQKQKQGHEQKHQPVGEEQVLIDLPGAPDGEADLSDAWISGIDVEEQRRMLEGVARRRAHMKQVLTGNKAGPSAGRGAKAKQQQLQGDGKKQLSIAAMFRKP